MVASKRELARKGGNIPGYLYKIYRGGRELRMDRKLLRTARYDWDRGRRGKGKTPARPIPPAPSGAASGYRYAESCASCTGVI